MRIAVVSIAGLMLLASCKKTDAPKTDAPTGGDGATAAVPEGPVCLPPATPSTTFMGPEDWPSAGCRERAAAIVGEMSLEDKLGQMMQPDIDQLATPADVSSKAVGSVLAGGNSGPKPPTGKAWAEAIDKLHREAAKTTHRIPILFGIDAIHGHNNVQDAVLFPHNIGLGATRDPALLESIARVTAEDVRATGMNWVFSPVLAAAQNERWGRTYEAFSEDPAVAELLGPAVVRGLQGDELGKRESSVLACAKHFIGDGNTTDGVDQGESSIDDAYVRDELLPAYKASIEAGVGSVMASYSSLRGTKMHCNGPWVTGVLKQELGFNGFVVSDWEAVEKIPGDYPERLAQTVNAGVDMIMHPKEYEAFLPTFASLVPETVPQERIDDAVTRILAVKCEMGLVPADGSDPKPMLAQRDKLKLFQAQQRVSLAREAVQKSMVLLKNEGVLPLDKAAKIHVAGKNADNMDNQCGGWSIGWQGAEGRVTKGNTILAGMKLVAGEGARISSSPDGEGADGASVGVVVVGETPYAEMMGDKEDLALDDADVRAIRAIKRRGLPVVVVVVAGRPLILDEIIDEADAVVAAWLPGTQGEGVADVLFGDVAPTGKLSYTWPASMAAIPINESEPAEGVLYPFGHGLSY